MIVLDNPAAMQAWSLDAHHRGLRVGLVPTMGALHAGHLALVEHARSLADVVVVSIFVNPLQFDRNADFDAYPRTMDTDLAACAAHDVDVVYAPVASTMYPVGFQTTVTPGALGDVLEGAARPGHFKGVTTVVTKLFNATQPTVAVFGDKDFQQLAIIRRMVSDLDMPVRVVAHPTVRDPDGLAMSSRNARLTPEQRAAAVVVPLLLATVRRAYRDGITSCSALRELAIATVANEPLARFEHLDIVDSSTLVEPDVAHDQCRVVTAVWFGDVRLIDNCAITD